MNKEQKDILLKAFNSVKFTMGIGDMQSLMSAYKAFYVLEIKKEKPEKQMIENPIKKIDNKIKKKTKKKKVEK